MIDSHCHLNDERYDVEAVVRDMKADGLSAVVVVGYDVPSSIRACEIAEKYGDVYFAAGVHPSDCVGLSDEDIARIVGLCSHPKAVAFGEIGLDYFYPDPPREVQREALVRQLYAVRETGKPAVFHVRDAYGDMDEILSAHKDCLRGGAVMHCFSGSKETALRYVDMGFYISFSGSVTFKNATKFTEIIRAVPRDRILVETDCPYLTPVPYRGQTNYPKFVRLTAAKIAEVLGITQSEVEEFTEENTRRIFGIRKEG